jgi:hypothetical protein
MGKRRMVTNDTGGSAVTMVLVGKKRIPSRSGAPFQVYLDDELQDLMDKYKNKFKAKFGIEPSKADLVRNALRADLIRKLKELDA